MERLTTAKHQYPPINTANIGYWMKIYDRLAEYEDTGRTPEDVRGIKVAYDTCQVPYSIYAIGADAIRACNLLNAYDEGRLIIPPVKTGQTVFSIDYGYLNTLHVMRMRPLIKTELFDYFPEDIGKRLFLSREEAEAALKQKD